MPSALARAATRRALDRQLFFERFDPRLPAREKRAGRGSREHRTIWISDTHLGTRGARVDLLRDFLRKNEADTIYLVGDILDGWRMRKSWHWDDDHNAIVSDLLEKSASGTRVVWVAGNHDEFLRRYLGHSCGGIELVDEAVHVTADGRRFLVLHGDRFDACIRNARWLALLGDHAYRVCLHLNTWFNAVRRRLGYGYWSLSAYLKHKVKNAVSYVSDFEHAVAREAASRGFDGVVCGHIHHAEIRTVEGILYCNDGDWVESCTALVEDRHGHLGIVRWASGTRQRVAREREAACAS